MKKILMLLLLCLVTLNIQGQTITEVRDLINNNLASGTKITAEKHREVENAIVSLIENSQNNSFLLKGSYVVGNITPSDFRVITFPSVGTANYLVVGSLVSYSGEYLFDNNVIWSILHKDHNQFTLILKEVSATTQNLTFNYALIPY